MKKKTSTLPTRHPERHKDAVAALEANGFHYGAPMWLSVEQLAADCEATWSLTCPVFLIALAALLVAGLHAGDIRR
jgi:hypothetical protein